MRIGVKTMTETLQDLANDQAKQALDVNDDAIRALHRGDKPTYNVLATEAERRMKLAGQLYRQHYEVEPYI